MFRSRFYKENSLGGLLRAGGGGGGWEGGVVVVVVVVGSQQRLTVMVVLQSRGSIVEQYVVVGADKAENNAIVVCEMYYLSRVIKELDLDNVDTEIRKENELE